MREQVAQAILERLCQIEQSINKLTRQQARTTKLLKEMHAMAKLTQAEIDQMASDVTTIKAAVVKIGEDLAAIEQNTELNADGLRAAIGEVRAQVQTLDDSIPERT